MNGAGEPGPRGPLDPCRNSFVEAYHFSEQPYPGAWDEDVESLRLTLRYRPPGPLAAA